MNNLETFRRMIGGKIIGYNGELAKVFSVTTAVILCQAAYYDCSLDNSSKTLLTDKLGNKSLYWWHTDAQWMDESGITEHELRAAKARLSDAGVLKWIRAGMPAKTYYQVDFNTLQELLNSHYKTRENLMTRPDKISGHEQINSLVIKDKKTDKKTDNIITGTPETAVSGDSNSLNQLPTILKETNSPIENKKPLVSISDPFEKDSDSNSISKFLLSFCRFVKTAEQRRDQRKDTIIGVRSEAKRLIEKKITLDQLNSYERWYNTTYAGEKRTPGQVLGYGYIRENWSAFEAACGVQGGVGIHMAIKTSDNRHEIKYTPDGLNVEILNKANGSVMRRMTVADYKVAFGGAL